MGARNNVTLKNKTTSMLLLQICLREWNPPNNLNPHANIERLQNIYHVLTIVGVRQEEIEMSCK